MDKHAIIKLKQKNTSNRKVAQILGIDRKTVARYWNEYSLELTRLKEPSVDLKLTQEKICNPPTYNSKNRKPRKYTREMDELLDEILVNESEKCILLKSDKQNLTQFQIHQMLVQEGYDISLSTVNLKLKQKRNKPKECFIKQDYDFGDRLEYDFGEVKLSVDGIVNTYHMAVLSSPASDFRWAYLYKNQKKEAFIDSHVRFFEMTKGVYKELVYDNMKNVVSRFIGKHEKELNQDLLKLSLYYGFNINVTNCYSGNEKGFVEGSVKFIRNKVFATHFKFKTYEEACNHLEQQLIQLNSNSKIREELPHLLTYKPMLELADIKLLKVNKYSFVRIDNNSYSVPEYLVDKLVSAKVYYNEIIIYANDEYVCRHKKIDGVNEISIDITHYLNSFTKKPGALKNSLALKSLPELKSIYENYFNKNPKEFIEQLRKNCEKPLEEIIKLLLLQGAPSNIIKLSCVKNERQLNHITRTQTSKYNEICLKRGATNDN